MVSGAGGVPGDRSGRGSVSQPAVKERPLRLQRLPVEAVMERPLRQERLPVEAGVPGKSALSLNPPALRGGLRSAQRHVRKVRE